MIDVVHQRGSVAEIHALDPFAGDSPVMPSVWWCDPTDDAIVLGSRQRGVDLDRDECARTGLSVVTRRSGGGAVLLLRSSLTWIDIVLPSGFAPDDVRGSMVWIGDLWHDVIHSTLDASLPLDVHRGGMECSAWSDLVCFAGVGPGEVTIAGEKVVGLSQRRTRRGIRIQCLVYGESVADRYRPLFRGDLPAGDPPGQGWLPGLDAPVVARAFADGMTPA